MGILQIQLQKPMENQRKILFFAMMKNLTIPYSKRLELTEMYIENNYHFPTKKSFFIHPKNHRQPLQL
jgi:hypothetical protein